LNKEQELRGELSWFLFDQTQLAKTFRRDVDDLKRMQQEHMCKLDTNLLAFSFDDLVQQQVNKYYHCRHLEDEDENEEPEFINKFDQIHDEHVAWLKKKKKNAKVTASIVERFRMLYISSIFYSYFFFCLDKLYDHVHVLDKN
jgi:hypothetical protein